MWKKTVGSYSDVAWRRVGIERWNYVGVILIGAQNLLELLTTIDFVAVGVQ